MNIYKVLNEITEYIDNHLEDKINYEDLAKMMGVNSYTMQRIFSLLTSASLAEYIRKRRLTSAGYDLCNYNLRVIDVAIKYQYDNATSFSRAFFNFHGIKPSLVTKDTILKNYPRITFNEDIKIADVMEYKTVDLEKLELYGDYVSVNNNTIGKKAPLFWNELEKKYGNSLGNKKYAMIEYEDSLRENCCKYYILFSQKIDDFEKIVIPASRWLVFSIPSQDAKDIQEMSHKFYFEFLPSCKFNLRELPELEYYHDGITDFLVPIY